MIVVCSVQAIHTQSNKGWSKHKTLAMCKVCNISQLCPHTHTHTLWWKYPIIPFYRWANSDRLANRNENLLITGTCTWTGWVLHSQPWHYASCSVAFLPFFFQFYLAKVTKIYKKNICGLFWEPTYHLDNLEPYFDTKMQSDFQTASLQMNFWASLYL
jgi:hypothetical protein